MKNMKGIGVLSAVIGMILYKVMSYYYGYSGPKLVMYICISLSLVILISLFIMKEFVAALFILIIGFPIVVITIGMYLDNVLVGVVGIILMCIILPIVIKIIPHLAKCKK